MKMKTGLLVLVVLLVLVSACGKNPSDEECKDAWTQIDWATIAVEAAKGETTMEGAVDAFADAAARLVSMVLNEEHSPDSIGYTLKACVERGWDWRAWVDAISEEMLK